MLKYPSQSRRPALGISCSPNCIEEETNAYEPPNKPVRNRVRGEIEKNPRQEHGHDSHCHGVCRPGRPQCKQCGENSCSLQAVADGNRESRKDPALRGGGRIHGFGIQDNLMGVLTGGKNEGGNTDSAKSAADGSAIDVHKTFQMTCRWAQLARSNSWQPGNGCARLTA